MRICGGNLEVSVSLILLDKKVHTANGQAWYRVQGLPFYSYWRRLLLWMGRTVGSDVDMSSGDMEHLEPMEHLPFGRFLIQCAGRIQVLGNVVPDEEEKNACSHHWNRYCF